VNTRWTGIRRRIRDLAFLAGVNLYQVKCLSALPRYIRDWRNYEARRTERRFVFRVGDMIPILSEFSSQAGVASGHYFHQDLHVARRIARARPARHVDIGSRIDGFVAHLLTFMPVTVIDVRDLESSVEGLTFARGDLVDLSAFATSSVASVSCLHTVEHVGLGRYGDTVDPDGWRKALSELCRILAPGGTLYLSVPIGAERVRFNADRIFSPATILTAMPSVRLTRFDAVDQHGNLRLNANTDDFVNDEESLGLFELTKDPQ
jgi:SAM-dependent methyltransferase